MRVEQLHYVMEIISCGSLTSAAKKLHTTQQALSVYIKALEEECGNTFFKIESRHYANKRRRSIVPAFPKSCE